ncbi:MAG: hypothetical protein AN483_12835 [Aphanizomenon flos-aquae MDT14a]|mgnify:CR=1 FL=1|jgi:hypothetical protein|uniref:Uncharacterized protein n=1 Tax=Aphanizomenon flos-aquae WA102 TaxID=1710896 RepID=A0A1B7X2U3_APHFL|nr:MAG: hypothetical protein AN483_12835 [Aphanizomenon flos-aquae MDT14a]OBQ43620.1 MAG: hypothetical protein AN484_11495 [Aphanizomenon flos-aquae WA102]
MTKPFANLETTEKNHTAEYGIRIKSIVMWEIRTEILFVYVAGVAEPVAFYVNESVELIAELRKQSEDFRPQK